MKTLTPIIVGDYTVTVTVEPHGLHVLKFVATCGEMRSESKLNPMGPHDHPEEQFEKDIQDEAERLAQECAGKCRAADLRAKFLEN